MLLQERAISEPCTPCLAEGGGAVTSRLDKNGLVLWGHMKTQPEASAGRAHPGAASAPAVVSPERRVPVLPARARPGRFRWGGSDGAVPARPGRSDRAVPAGPGRARGRRAGRRR